MSPRETHCRPTLQGWWSTNPYLCDIREAMFPFSSVGKVRGQGTVWMRWVPHAESHRRDLTWKHLEGWVLLWWLRSDLFLFRASWIILTSQGSWSWTQPGLKLWGYENMWGAEQEVVCAEDVTTGSDISLGRIPSVSCSYTLLFVSRLSLRLLQAPDQLGLSHYISVCALTSCSLMSNSEKRSWV